jgi:hypothetical protein
MRDTQMQITLNTAHKIVDTLLNKQTANTSNINVTTVINALITVKGTTFATLTQCSPVAVAAAHRAQRVFKITVQNVTLCNSDAGLYNNAVTREVRATAQADTFTALPSNYVMLNNSYSVCALKSNTNKHYLRAIVNKCLQVVYYCANTDTLLSLAQVAQFLSPSASKALLTASTSTHINHANITHTVIARTFSLQNIYSINVNKNTLTA